MKCIARFAEFVGYRTYYGERVNEWRCPNKNCGFGVVEEWECCPYCGQKIKFGEIPAKKLIDITPKEGNLNGGIKIQK